MAIFDYILLLKIIQLIITLILIFVLPLFVIFTSPIFSFRYVVSKARKWLRPDLRKMVTARGVVCAADDLYKNPSRNIVIEINCKGTLEIERVRQIINQTILKCELPDGQIRYPELKQYLTNWAGFLFWKDCSNFHVNNQVILYENAEFKESTVNSFGDNLNRIRQELIRKKWTRKQPIWEIVVIKNSQPEGHHWSQGPYTTLMFRFHHALGDGYSWLQLLTDVLLEPKKQSHLSLTKVERDFYSTLLFWIKFPFQGCFEFAKVFSYPLMSLPFKISEDIKTNNVYTACSEKLSISKIKEIKNAFGVSFSSVIYAIICGAMRDILIQKGQPWIPRIFPVAMVLPLPNHPIKMRNYLTGASVMLPLGEPNPVTRLKLCFKEYNLIKESPAPLFYKIFFKLAGCYFTSMVNVLMYNRFVVAGVSSFPGPLQQLYLDGKIGVDTMFTSGLQGGVAGITFQGLSYMDGLRMAVTAEAAVMTEEEVHKIPVLLKKHLDSLCNCIYKTN